MMIGFQFQRLIDLTCYQHLPVASNRSKTQIILQTERFFLTFQLHFWEKLWPTPRTNTPKTYRANFTLMINASIAICAAKRRLRISNETMTAAIPTSTSNQRLRKKKDFAKRRWKAARSKRSG